MSIREDKDRVELSLDVNHLTDKKEIRVFYSKNLASRGARYKI